MKRLSLALLIISLVSVSVCADTPSFEYVATIGKGTLGGGSGQFNSPTDVFVDATGRLFVADATNHRVKVFDKDHAYIAALGTTGEPGPNNYKLRFPTNVYVDPSGTIYVSDRMNHRIQVFNSDLSYASTLGTTGSPGTGNDQFNSPTKVFKDTSGKLYVVDNANNRVQVFDASLQYSDTIDGFSFPWGIHIDGSGRIIVSDMKNHQVKLFDQQHQPAGTIGTGTAGNGNDQFNLPYGVFVDASGNIFVSEYSNSRVQVFDKDLVYIATLGLPVQGENYQFVNPEGIFIDSTGKLYVAETNGHKVKVFRIHLPYLAFDHVGQIGTGSPGSGTDSFNVVYDVAVGVNDRIYVADSLNNRVQILTPDGSHLDTIPITNPRAVYVDNDGRLFISYNEDAVKVLDSDLNEVATLGGNGQGAGNDQFQDPRHVAVDGSGNIYVVDNLNNRIQVFNSNFEYVATIGTGAAQHDNTGFSGPKDIEIGADGTMYISDVHNHRIQLYTPERTYKDTWGGSQGTELYQYQKPNGLHLDPWGRLFVADYDNQRIKVLDQEGGVIGVIGTGEKGSGPGEFNNPISVTMNSTRYIFVADPGNHRIQVFRERPLLDLSFDDTLEGADGETPTTSTGIEYSDGVSGKGVLIDDGDILTYPRAGNFDIEQGTVEFWVKPQQLDQNNYLFNIGWSESDYGKNWFKIGFNANGTKIQWFTKNKGERALYGALTPFMSQVGEWYHIAMTWKEGDLVRFFINGELLAESDDVADDGYSDDPYRVSSGWETSPETQVIMIGFYDVTTDASYRPQMEANAVIDELRILNYPLSEDEVRARYTEMRPIPIPTTTITTTPTENDWPMWRRDLQHSGVTTGGPGSDLELAWKFETGDEVQGSPSIAGGKVYIGSKDNHLYALEAATGVLVWKFKAGNFVRSTPAIADGRIFFGADGVYSLDATSGSLLWKFNTTGNPIYSSPAVVNGIVHIGGMDKHVYALDAVTGTEIWRFETGDDPNIYCSPAVVDGIVYIGSDNPYMFALNASTGAEIWRFRTKDEIFSSPTVKDGVVYFGSENDDGNIYALDASTGSKLWNHTNDLYGIGSSPTIADGIVYIGTKDRHVYALDSANGAEIWDFEMKKSTSSSPAVSDGVVYIGSADNNTYALDAATGALLWSYEMGDFVTYTSPAIGKGLVVIGSFDHHVYAFRARETVAPTATIDIEESFVDDFNDGVDTGWKPVLGSWIVEDGTYKSDINTSMSIDKAFRTLSEHMIARNAIMTVKVMLNSSNCGNVNHLTAEGGPLLRMVDDNNGYGVKIQSSSGITFVKIKDGGIAYPEGLIGNKLKHMICEAWYNVKFLVNETNLKAKAWKEGIDEPSDWDVEVNDTEFKGTGMIGLFQSRGGPIYFDDVNVTDLDHVTAVTPPPTSPSPAPTPVPSVHPTPEASPSPTSAPEGNETQAPSPSEPVNATSPSPSAPVNVTSLTPTPPEPTGVSPAPSSSPLPTAPDTPLLDNGRPCTSNDECQSNNCAGGVCCIPAMTCCDANADCPPDNHCDTERFYCVPEGEGAPEASATPPQSQEEMKADAETRLKDLKAKLSELKTRSPVLEVTTVESVIAQAEEKLLAGDFSEAYRLSVEAGTAFTDAKKKLKLAIGKLCFENSECDTGNCQNKICCKAGKTCCDKNAHCDEGEVCDTERSFCVSEGDDREEMTAQERIADALTDPGTVMSIVAAAVLGVGFGLYQLKGRIEEKKAQEKVGHLEHQVQQMQYYGGQGGQWQQPQQGWDKPPGRGGT